MFETIIAVMMLLLGLEQVPMQHAKELMRERDHEGSIKTLEAIKLNKGNYSTYCFHMAVNHFQLNHKKEATKWIDLLEASFDNSPERYQVVASMMRADMKNWKNDYEDVEDISREMKKVSDRLHNAKGGAVTQKTQKEIVDRLDKLIKDAEDKLDKQQQGKGDGQGKEQPGQQKQGSGQSPQTPQGDSQIAPSDGTGMVQNQKMKNLIEKWGSLPQREQARAMQELTQGMSRVHREAIENYFRNLAAAQSKNKR